MDVYKKINLIGSIDYKSYEEFVEQLDKLEKKPRGIIPVELSSDGGDAYVALAFYDKIISCKHEIHITARGLVASAAVLILAAGDRRKAPPTAWILLHEDEVALLEGQRVTSAEQALKHSRRLENQWGYLLEAMTKTNYKQWNEAHKNEEVISARQAKELGLIDELI